MKKRLLVCFATWLLFFNLVNVVNATLIEWNFDFTLTAIDSLVDPLNIDGETGSLNLIFDNNDTWVSGSTYLFFPTSSSFAAISGGHTVTLNTPSPVAAAASSGVGFTEQFDSSHYLDFIIDGNMTTMHYLKGAPSIAPSMGDHLLPEHLITSFFLNPSLGIGLDNPVATYRFDDPIVSISAPVPEPATMLLFGTGLVGLVGARMRKKKK